MNQPLEEVLLADQKLLTNIKRALPELEALLEECSSHWGYEDPIYRFYHGSFKVYALQSVTNRIVDLLRTLSPGDSAFDPKFSAIISSGAGGKEFDMEHNKDWAGHTRPMVEAFLHARFFLEMAVKYGRELESAPQMLPSGWAALLCLFGLRK